ncbi:MAG: hypothetical protein IT470_02125 [Pseudomonadales bacterium]|nr:hypothetical protein [Pseudomonadales bacterium]
MSRSIWHSEQRGGKREADETILKGLIERHAQHTGSVRAEQLLRDWEKSRGLFVKVFPNEYRRALSEMMLLRKSLPHWQKRLLEVVAYG